MLLVCAVCSYLANFGLSKDDWNLERKLGKQPILHLVKVLHCVIIVRRL